MSTSEALIEVDETDDWDAEPVKAELMSKAQQLFYEGQVIGEELENNIANAIDGFYQKALAYAQTVWAAQPWTTSELAEFYDVDPNIAFKKFLRAAFGGRSETSRQQSQLIATLIIDEIPYETIRGVSFRRLLSLAQNCADLNKKTRLSLIECARTDTTALFRAKVKSAKTGHHIELRKDKLIQISESAEKTIDQYVDTLSDLGDKRVEGEKIADACAIALLEDATGLEQERIKLFREVWIRLFGGDPNASIMSTVTNALGWILNSVSSELSSEEATTFAKLFPSYAAEETE